MRQMSLYDFIPKDLPLGWIADEDVETFKGDIIPFNQLAECIGEKIIEELPRECAVDYRVVLVKRYLTACDEVYRWENGESEFIGMCDRVALSDDNRKGKENMWVSEMYCRTGRYKASRYPTCFFRIKGK